MEDIKPFKVIVTDKPNELSDTKENREGYDPRVISPDNLPDDISHYALYNYFSFETDDKQDEKKNDQLKVVNRWCIKKSGTRDMMDIYRALRSLETRLGIAPMGQDRLGHIYEYVALNNKIEELEGQRMHYETRPR